MEVFWMGVIGFFFMDGGLGVWIEDMGGGVVMNMYNCIKLNYKIFLR